MYLDLILNLSLLVALVIVSNFLERRKPTDESFGSVIQGLLFGIVAVIAMLRPAVHSPGLIFDGRSIVLSLCGLFFGTYAVLPAMAIAIVCRTLLGGIGMITGILSILVSSLAGLYYRRIKNREINSITNEELFKFGFFTHCAVLMMMLTLPDELSFEILIKMAIPFLVFYPLATLLAGKILLEHRQMFSYIESLDKLNEEQRRVFESIIDGVIVTDLNGRVINLNPAAANLTGWDPQSAKGKMISEVLSVAAQSNQPTLPLEQQMNSAIKEGKTANLGDSIVLINRNGKKYYVDVAVSPIKISDEKTIGAVCVLHNKTPEKEAESKIQLLQRAIETAGFAVIVTDKEEQIEYVNPAFVSMYGYAPEECIGKKPETLISSHPYNSEFYSSFENILKSGEVWSGDLINRRKDGSVINVKTTIIPIKNNKNEITNYVEICEDLTKTRSLEEQLLQAQKMEVIGRLATGVAHDFNNVLSIIKLCADLIRGCKNLTDEGEKSLEYIEKSVQNATNIAQRILAFSRVKNTELFVIDINELIGGMSKMLQRLLGSDIVVKIRGFPAKMMVEADRTALEQAIMNLAINARDAMPRGGTLEITTDFIYIDKPSTPEQRVGEFITLSVKDTGTGIPPEILPRIFDPFFTTKGPDKGTGLGLTIVKDIVSKHKGWIEVESTPASGSKFTIFLPRHSETKTPTPQTSPNKEMLKGNETILLVEDDATVRILTAKLLKANGYIVIEASDGQSAINKFAELNGAINLLLTDIVLTGRLSGYDVAKKLKEKKPDLKIVFITGYPTEIEKSVFDLVEGENVLLKPLSELKLLQIIRRTLDTK
ncbi:MAG: PAS domain S-box protein [Verrucomicrobiia bacterium]